MTTAPPLPRKFPDRRDGRMTERNARIRPAIIKRMPIETMGWSVNLLGPLVIAFEGAYSPLSLNKVRRLAQATVISEV